MTKTNWEGYTKGTGDFTRMLIAMFCAGIVTFALILILRFPERGRLAGVAAVAFIAEEARAQDAGAAAGL